MVVFHTRTYRSIVAHPRGLHDPVIESAGIAISSRWGQFHIDCQWTQLQRTMGDIIPRLPNREVAFIIFRCRAGIYRGEQDEKNLADFRF